MVPARGVVHPMSLPRGLDGHAPSGGPEIPGCRRRPAPPAAHAPARPHGLRPPGVQGGSSEHSSVSGGAGRGVASARTAPGGLPSPSAPGAGGLRAVRMPVGGARAVGASPGDPQAGSPQTPGVWGARWARVPPGAAGGRGAAGHPSGGCRSHRPPAGGRCAALGWPTPWPVGGRRVAGGSRCQRVPAGGASPSRACTREQAGAVPRAGRRARPERSLRSTVVPNALPRKGVQATAASGRDGGADAGRRA